VVLAGRSEAGRLLDRGASRPFVSAVAAAAAASRRRCRHRRRNIRTDDGKQYAEAIEGRHGLPVEHNQLLQETDQTVVPRFHGTNNSSIIMF